MRGMGRFVFLCALSAAGIAGGQTVPREMVIDDLVYDSREEALAVWHPADERVDTGRLLLEKDGIGISDLRGDCWKDSNDHRAVFLRDPRLDEGYFFEAAVEDLVPGDPYAQAGLVAWSDADNYLRMTVGFRPAGYECLGEIAGDVPVYGIYRTFPLEHPFRARLRIEVGRRFLAAFVSFDDGPWHPAGALMLPEDVLARDWIRGIGLIGVGGRAESPPRFREWREGSLPGYRDDAFTEGRRRASWRLLSGAPEWGRTRIGYGISKGTLRLRAMPGADVYFDNANYPCVEQPAPAADSWRIEAGIRRFDGEAPGRWHKAGLILWQGDRNQVIVCAVSDEESDHMYFESLVDGNGVFPRRITTAGYRPREATGAFLRLTRSDGDLYRAEASWDGTAWFDLGESRPGIEEGRLRLFVSGDVLMECPHARGPEAAFDFIRFVVGGETGEEPVP